MTNVEAKPITRKKLVQGNTRFSYGEKPVKRTCTKKRVQHVKEPHLEKRIKNGYTYYVYRHGIDPPIHLGTADTILRAVKAVVNGKV